MSIDLTKFTEHVAQTVRTLMEPMEKRIQALEAMEKRVPEKGDDGVGVAGGMIDGNGNLIITTSDGRTHDVGHVRGADGKDGLTLQSFTASYERMTGLNLRMSDGESEKEINILPPIFEHQGFWSQGKSVSAGNTITHNGSLWIAKCDTDQEPGYQADDWNLAARKGADKK